MLVMDLFVYLSLLSPLVHAYLRLIYFLPLPVLRNFPGFSKTIYFLQLPVLMNFPGFSKTNAI